MSFLFRRKDTSNKTVRAKHIKDLSSYLQNIEWVDANTFDYTIPLQIISVKIQVFIPEDYPADAPIIRVLTPCTHAWVDSSKTLSLCPTILNWNLSKENNLLDLLSIIEKKFNTSPPLPDNSQVRSSSNSTSGAQNNQYSAYNPSIYNPNSSNIPSNQVNTQTPTLPQNDSQQLSQSQQAQNPPTIPLRPTAGNASSYNETLRQKIVVLTPQQAEILKNASKIATSKNEFSSMTQQELERIHDALELSQNYALTHSSITPLFELRDELLTSLENAITENLKIKNEISILSSSIEKDQEELVILQSKVLKLLQEYKLMQEKYSPQLYIEHFSQLMTEADDESYAIHENSSELLVPRQNETQNQAIQRYLRDYMESRKKYHLASGKEERIAVSSTSA